MEKKKGKKCLKDRHGNVVTCQNPECKAYHSEELADIQKFGYQDKEKKIQRYRCKHCGVTFNDKRGTVFEQLQYDEETVTMVAKMYDEGNSILAIERMMEINEDTIRKWLRKIAKHCLKVTDYHFTKNGKISTENIQLDEFWTYIKKEE